jgi:hypothetical protein
MFEKLITVTGTLIVPGVAFATVVSVVIGAFWESRSNEKKVQQSVTMKTYITEFFFNVNLFNRKSAIHSDGIGNSQGSIQFVFNQVIKGFVGWQ